VHPLALIAVLAALAAPPPVNAPLPKDGPGLRAAYARTTTALDSALDRWGGRGPIPREVGLEALYQERIVRLLATSPALARAVPRALSLARAISYPPPLARAVSRTHLLSSAVSRAPSLARAVSHPPSLAHPRTHPLSRTLALARAISQHLPSPALARPVSRLP